MVKKPRKRRTQTMAEATGGPVYLWKRLLNSYSFNPSEACNIVLTEMNGKWTMKAVINRKTYVGTRDTLEDAFKATAHLMFKKAKDYWLRMDARIVTAPWAHDLPEA